VRPSLKQQRIRSTLFLWSVCCFLLWFYHGNRYFLHIVAVRSVGTECKTLYVAFILLVIFLLDRISLQGKHHTFCFFESLVALDIRAYFLIDNWKLEVLFQIAKYKMLLTSMAVCVIWIHSQSI
jgi:hypothetical protein